MNRAPAVEVEPTPCQGDDPDLWFADHPGDIALAKSFCEPCPLRTECLHGALDRGEPEGVWGGELVRRGRITPAPRRLVGLDPIPARS
ncbi:WhiB family transcriptional regulator [Gordonia soli]|uniref:WhiB family transcriptional regulator n=1 Tax=Gordonia soli TaxID=320799 RepID=UPI000347C57A|nr:WhiB family transcriptional regulator [Gordonia soli]